MKNELLLELAKRWEQDAEISEKAGTHVGPGAAESLAKGDRMAKRECADGLRTLIKLVG